MKKNLTDIVMLLDRSGSMQSIKTDTIGGVNAFIVAQREVPGEANFTLVQFDDIYEMVFTCQNIKSVPPLTAETFVPRGWTALLDSVGRLINETGKRLAALAEKDRPEKVLFVIVTDGEENSSREFTKEKVLSMIKHQTENYSWEFIYLGANQDSIKVGGSIGISAFNCLDFDNTGKGTRNAFVLASNYSSSYRSTGKGNF